MTEVAFHLTVPSLRVALAAVVLATTGCSGMMDTPTASSIAGLSPSGRVTITEDFVTGLGAGNGTLGSPVAGNGRSQSAPTSARRFSLADRP